MNLLGWRWQVLSASRVSETLFNNVAAIIISVTVIIFIRGLLSPIPVSDLIQA